MTTGHLLHRHRAVRRCSGRSSSIARIPREAKRLEDEAGEGSPPLRRRQLMNVGLVMLVSQGLQVLIVSLTIGAFFVVFGLLAIDESTSARTGSASPATPCSSSTSSASSSS